jgi:hypothetical protein
MSRNVLRSVAYILCRIVHEIWGDIIGVEIHFHAFMT